MPTDTNLKTAGQTFSLTAPVTAWGELQSGYDGITRHGDVFTIIGSGFGTQPQFAFAGGATGRIENAALGVDGVDSGGFVLSSERPKEIVNDTERGKVWYSDVDDGSGASADNGVIAHDWGSSIPSGSKIYRHFVTKINCDAPAYQWKFWRQEPTFNFSDGGPECYCMFWKKDTGRYFGVRPMVAAGEAVLTYFGGAPYDAIRMDAPVWFSQDYYQVLGDEGVANGIDFGVINSSVGLLTLFDKTNSLHIESGVSLRPRWQVLQNYLGNYSEGAPTVGEVWVDDFYVQVAPPGSDLIRVYMTDSPVFSSSTMIPEIQAPASAWTDTALKISINRGGMTNGTRYLHVVANKNTVLQTVQIELGS